MSETLIKTKREGAAFVITLSRPDKRNAMTNDMMNQLEQAVISAAYDREARAVVIHGDGKVVTERHFGFVKVMIGEQRSAAVAVSSLGVSALPGSFTLGWTDWRGVSIGQDDAGSCLFINFDTTHTRE